MHETEDRATPAGFRSKPEASRQKESLLTVVFYTLTGPIVGAFVFWLIAGTALVWRGDGWTEALGLGYYVLYGLPIAFLMGGPQALWCGILAAGYAVWRGRIVVWLPVLGAVAGWVGWIHWPERGDPELRWILLPVHVLAAWFCTLLTRRAILAWRAKQEPLSPS